MKLALPWVRLVNSDGDQREWRSELLPRYRRSSPEVEQAVLGVYLSGGNRRGIHVALKLLPTGAPLSKSRAIAQLHQEEFRRRVQTQASLSSEKAALLVFFGLFASGQVQMRRIEGWGDLPQAAAMAA